MKDKDVRYYVFSGNGDLEGVYTSWFEAIDKVNNILSEQEIYEEAAFDSACLFEFVGTTLVDGIRYYINGESEVLSD